MARKAASRNHASRPLDPAERDRQILAALDLRSEFASLGVVFAKDFPNAAGWLDCYAVGRDDRTPSAGCNIRTGRYHDFGGGENVSFWEFAATHGNFADWRAAREHYAAKVGVPPLPSGVAGNGGTRVTRPSTSTARQSGGARSTVAQSSGHAGNGKLPRNPLDQLSFLDWSPAYERLARLWCLKHKRGVTIEAIHAAGGRPAIYKTKTKAYTVLALPVWGPELLAAEPVAYVAYQLNGQPLPVFRGKGKPIEWIKIKTFGLVSGGLIGRHGIERIQAGEAIEAVWKVEGPSDLLALWSAIPPEERDRNPIVCNAGGAAEYVQPNVASFFAGLSVNIIHDADQAGENGAFKTDKSGRISGWLPSLVGIASQIRHVRLPYDVEPKHGKDLRDYLRDQGGDGFRELLTLATQADPYDGAGATYDVKEVDPSTPYAGGHQPSANGHDDPSAPLHLANEADNDPHRLARVYLAQQARTLRYWRQEWWRYDGWRYVRFSVSELAAELTATCKAEFDRINLAAIQSPDAANADGKLPEVLKVARGLVSNVIGALEGECIVAGAIEQPAWIGEPPTAAQHPGHHPSPHCIALTNGILDLDSLLAGEEDRSKILLPHSPAWFSPICLPYDFNEEADCPRWNAFLSRNLEDDAERINLLQEWAGYLLLPDANQQKFLFLEGEGSNGKSVYHAAIEGMLGRENVAHVPLESFGERFALYSTIGKLANIAADCGELDKAAEGILKSFTSGDRMTFDRKNLPPVEATPTARLSIAANNRPRFSDRSSGLWRRLMIVPFNVQIEESEKVKGMDKPEWWQAAGELPGILNWAIAGLWRLREQGRFTESQLGAEALEDYRSEANPARAFLQMTCRLAEAQISCGGLYDAYKSWSKENGYHPVNERNFGKEVFRVFSKAERRRIGTDGNRSYVYFGLFAAGIDF